MSVRVRVKTGAADAYLKSGHNKDNSTAYREEVGKWLRAMEGLEFNTRPLYDGDKIIAYEVNANTAFLPEDVDVIEEGE